MRTLFAIEADREALHEILADVGGDISEAEAEAAIDAWLAENDEDLKEKLERYRLVIRELQASAEFRKAEAEVRTKAAARDLANIERMKRRLLEFMERQELRVVDLPSGGRFSISSNGGTLPLEVDLEPEDLPEPFRLTKTTVIRNDRALRDALDKGEALWFARYGERGVHLRMK